jgi:hypothetical protein
MRRTSADGGAVIRAARWTGRLASVVGLAAWSIWIAWRVLSVPIGVVGVVVLVLEVAALLVSVVLSAALWSMNPPAMPTVELRTRRSATPTALPDVLVDLLGVDELRDVGAHGADDTGEVARARTGLRLLDPRTPRTGGSPRPSVGRHRLAMTAWALVAVEGIRRMVFVAVLVAVLLTGRLPFEMPHWSVLAALIGAQASFAIAHWLLSGGVLRPGVRLRWSMATVGAGLGDGASRTGLPIRWTATLATMVVLNLAVALRGVSDRWTHGLGPMPHDERVAAMALSWWLVIVGFAALRILVKPSLGYYGATGRLEEPSTRRLALGATLAIALVGFVAGALPSGLPA